MPNLTFAFDSPTHTSGEKRGGFSVNQRLLGRERHNTYLSHSSRETQRNSPSVNINILELYLGVEILKLLGFIDIKSFIV